MKNNLINTATILAGGLAFAGSVNAATVFTEDFESGAGQWQTSWGVYAGNNYSGDPHSSVTNPGTNYGNLIGNTGATVDAAPVLSNAVALSASDISAAAAGTATYDFSGWLASFTGNSEVTQISVQFYSDTAGTGGNEVGASIMLADGTAEGSSTTPSGAWNNKNWSNYTASGTVATGAQSFIITYGTSGGNDAYADNLSFTVTPEPSSTALLGLGGLALILRRRK